MANRAHSKAYLESLLQSPPPSGAIGSRPHVLVRTSSGIGLTLSPSDIHQFKPTRSSGLAVEDSGEESFSDNRREEKGSFGGGLKDLFSVASSVSSLSEDDEVEEPSRFLRVQTSASKPNNVSNTVQAIIKILDNEEMDDEVRVEQAREMIAAALMEVEGITVTPARLDNIVLALLHRHREDVRPTGATFAAPASPSPSPFPASPRSRPRPASLRSISGASVPLSRPWTPSLPLTPTSSTMNYDNGPSTPTSPMLIPQNISIGNGSPKASPSLWHRSLSNSATLTAAANPWAQSSPASSSSLAFAPLGPPGDTIGSPPKTATFGTSMQQPSSSTVNTISRPASPGGNGSVDSPRLNVAAVAFKPRGPTTPVSMTRGKSSPWAAEERERSTAAANHSDESDEDEFSPFAGQGVHAVPVPDSSSCSSASSSRLAMGRIRPISGASGNSSIQSFATVDSISGSYQDSTTSASLESSDGQQGTKSAVSGDDDVATLTMTPFDVLSSILSSSNVGASVWTNEELEEALEMNNWDIDATLTAIMDSGGMPSATSINRNRSPKASSRPVPTSGHSGVSLVSRDSFNGQRGASAENGDTINPHLTLAQRQQLQQQQQGLGPGKVCRYFLAGECRRADCRFSHDLNRAVCRFWMKGQCLNGEGCSFLHDMSIVDRLSNRITSTSIQDPSTSQKSESESTQKDDFPELGMPPTGPKAQRGRGAGGYGLTPGLAVTNDPSRTRWAQALQKRSTTPMALMQQGDARQGMRSPSQGIPTGPKGIAKNVMASRIPLRAPLLLPTLLTGKEASQNYASHRGTAISLSEKRNKMLMRAAEAWKRGDGMEAKKWSREAQDVNKVLQDESRTSSRSLLKERHEEIRRRLLEDLHGSKGLVDPSMDEKGSRGLRGRLMGDGMGVCLGVVPKTQSGSMGNTALLSMEERVEVLLDLHSMHATEAIEVVEEFLMNLERENYRGLAILATGLGRHTSQDTDRRRVGLAAGIKGFLSSWAYPFSEHNGVIVVDPLTHS